MSTLPYQAVEPTTAAEADAAAENKGFPVSVLEAKEAVETKNRADSTIFQMEKTLEDLGDKVSEDEKAPVKEAIEKLRNTMNSGDTEAIKADTEALEKAFYPLAEKLYGQQGGAQGAPGGQDYYDADYTVVDDDKK